MNFPMTHDCLPPGINPRQGVTVAQLKALLAHWPDTTESGAQTRVFLALDQNCASPLRLSDGMRIGNSPDLHLRLQPIFRQRDTGDDSAKATPVDLALAVCSYLRYTPIELFDENYCYDLVDRAQEGLEALKRAQHGLAMTGALKPARDASRQPLLARLVLAPLVAIRACVAPLQGLTLRGRLHLLRITFVELLKP